MTGANRLYNVRLITTNSSKLPSLPFLLSLVLVSRHFLLWRTATGRSMGLRFSDKYEWSVGVDTAHEMN